MFSPVVESFDLKVFMKILDIKVFPRKVFV